MARPSKPHHCSWNNQPIVGLGKCSDGRWRIIATGKKFSEPDEAKAIARFEAMSKKATIALPVDITAGINAAIKKASRREITITVPRKYTEEISVERVVPADEFYAFARAQILNRPDEFARKVGLPELSSFVRDRIRKPSIKIDAIRESYLQHGSSTIKAKQEALAPFDRLVKFVDGKSLDDLTDAGLTKWRESVVSNPNLKSSATISGYFSRIRNVLRIAARGDLDAVQLDAAIARCKAKLYSPPSNINDNPHPISRENFHLLLESVGKTDIPQVWRAMLLLGLNGALYMEDLCSLEWDSLDLDAATLVSRRRKKGQCLRVATLWPETVAVISAIPRRRECPYVFVSTTGTRYNKNTKINDFADFRRKAGVVDVSWSHLRDGSYSAAAVAPGVDEKFARLLAGHRSPGLQDKYVIRNPRIVEPACSAVYLAYGPFPPSEH